MLFPKTILVPLVGGCECQRHEYFIRRQQRNFLPHLVRHDDMSMCKRLTFDENARRPGRHIKMEEMVHQHRLGRIFVDLDVH